MPCIKSQDRKFLYFYRQLKWRFPVFLPKDPESLGALTLQVMFDATGHLTVIQCTEP